jgi:LytS/YehU family sensor histidine kinase
MKLSRIMRYTLEESQTDFVSLQQEIEFINSYIELQKIRLTDKVDIKFETCGNTGDVKIAPLLFIPFIENAFKYGISTHVSSSILVQLKVADNILTFICRNDSFPHAAGKQESTGTGIINTQRRLELLYNKKYELLIQEANNQYNVHLTINLNV